MWIYSHTTWTLRGYTRLTHEAVQFVQDEISEVTEEVGAHLLCTYPLQFCGVDARATVAGHQRACPLSPKHDIEEQPTYANRRIPKPPRNRQMRTA